MASYRVLGPLGRGRLGEVSLAEDGGGARVALLQLSPELCAQPGLKGRLFAIAERLRVLSHPGILRPTTFGEEDGQVLLFATYLSGQSLGEWLDADRAERASLDPGGPLDPLDLGCQIAEALAAAHGRGLYHGDLQPKKVRLLRAPGAPPRVIVTGVGVIQALDGEEADEASYGQKDVLSLGRLLSQLLNAGERIMSTAPTLPPPGEGGNRPAVRDPAELLAQMLIADASLRPSMERALAELLRLRGPRPGDGLQPGQSVGNYRLVRRLGQGGMGVVFEAVHTRLSRQVAIKVLRPELSQDQEMVHRFFTEAESVNIVRHPGIVSIYEFGQLPDKTVYIVMEYLGGDSLEERLHKAGGRLGLPSLRLLRQVASALQAAHERGVVHRDLKPENVMIVADPEVPGGERTKVLDFGIAKMAADYRRSDPHHRPTEVGQALGTPQYMSPEQCQDAGAVDDRADVYSLGIMLFEVLTGRLPFQARGFAAVAAQHLHEAPPSLRSIDPTIPEPLEHLILAMLAKAPLLRPPMSEVAEGLERVLSAFASSLSPSSPGLLLPSSPTVGTKTKTAPLLAVSAPPERRVAAGLGLAVLVILFGAALLWRRQAAPPAAAPPAVAPSNITEAVAPPPAPAKEVDLLSLRARALSVLKEGMRDGDPMLRRRALALLGASRDLRHAALIESALADLDAMVQAQAAAALAQLGAREAVSALVSTLARAKGPSPRVEVAIGAALSQLADPRGDAVLRRAAKGRDEDARRRAALLLLERADRRARRALLRAPLDEDLLALLGRLARAGDKDATQLLQRSLGTAEGEAQLRIAEELAHAEDPSGRALLEQTARAAGAHKLRAARALSSLDDPSHLSLLTERFVDENQPLADRLLSAEGLGACGRRESAALLEKALPKEAGALRLRMAAAGAILQIAASDLSLLGQESMRLAETSLDGVRLAERQEAALSLGEAEPRQAVPLLHRAMRDQAPQVRRSAAVALGRTRVRAAVPALGEALDDSARVVRREAMNSIGQVGRHLRQRGERVDDIVGTVAGRLERVDKGDEGEKLAGVTALLRLGDRSRREQLRSWLKARDPEMRREAVEAWSADLSEDGDAEPLLTALGDAVFAVRFAAAARLAERGRREAIPVLKEALLRKGPEALLSHGHLSRLGVPSAVEAVLSAGPVSARLATVAAAAHLPAAEALSLLRKGARDGAQEVRHKVIEVAADLPELSGSPAGLRLLESLRGDAEAGVRVHAGLLLARLGGRREKARDGHPDLDRAQAEYLIGHYDGAIALLRKDDGQQAFAIVGAAACRKGDGGLAEEAYRRLQDPSMRRYVAAICQHTRTQLPGEAPPAAPPPLRPRAAPSPAAPPERAITNDRIGLPPRALKSKIEIQE